MNDIDYTNDPRAVLIHFNPNHDKLGRFAKSSFGGRQNLTKANSKKYNKDRMLDDIDKEKLKKYALVGAGIVATSLLVVGGVYLAKSGKLSDMAKAGKLLVDETVSNLGDHDLSELVVLVLAKLLNRYQTLPVD